MSEDRQPAADGQAMPQTQAEDQAAPTRQPPDARSPGRRGFLLGTGGLAAAALVGGGGWLLSEQVTSARPTATKPLPSGSGSVLDVAARRTRALQLRITTAQQQLRDPFPQPQPNGDEARYADDVLGLANFTKALPHNHLGEVDPDAYRALLRALRSGRPADFRGIPLGGRVKLANPEGAFSFELQGPDPWQRPLAAPPRMDSEPFAAEMTECYWLALARDVPYRRYGQEPITEAAIADLRRFGDYRDLDPDGLFRSPELPGVNSGPYISQFLVQPYTLGSTPTTQRYRTTVPGSDHLTSYPEWLAAQNGRPASTEARFDPTPRFIRNGRDLGEWSHRDFSYQGPLVAALILLDYVARYGPQVLSETNPYREHPTQTGVVTFGAPDILDQVARSANAAMKAAWYHKWLVHRRLRPEEAGGRLHHHLTGTKAYPLHAKLTNSAAPERVYSRYGSYLCPQAYPEGCPTHPAYPGATAAIGGAGIRVLKAFFNPDFVIPEPVVPTDDGRSLRPWRGEPLTVGGELNKLAFNMAFGRDTAGVHFRRDEVDGILL